MDTNIEIPFLFWDLSNIPSGTIVASIPGGQRFLNIDNDTKEQLLHYLNRDFEYIDLSCILQKIEKIKIIKKWLKKYYWIWREKYERKRMHPDSEYLQNIVNNFD